MADLRFALTVLDSGITRHCVHLGRWSHNLASIVAALADASRSAVRVDVHVYVFSNSRPPALGGGSGHIHSPAVRRGTLDAASW